VKADTDPVQEDALEAARLHPAARTDLGAPAPQQADDDALLPAGAITEGTLGRMLLSALVRFSETSYHGVPVREIARGAGVRASSMYEHSSSKEQLLLELMLIGHREHLRNVTEALEATDADPTERLRAVTRAHVRFHVSYPMLARVCNRELSSLTPESLEQVLEVRRRGEQLILNVIEQGVAAGVFVIDEPWLAAAAIGGMGIRVAEWYRSGARYSADEIADAYATYALRVAGATDNLQ
jgi:AcrR family transcriptional regulator